MLNAVISSNLTKAPFILGSVPTRNFATLKDSEFLHKSNFQNRQMYFSMFQKNFPVSIRLKSVKNIQKITKSMKMVAAAKYAKAERELRPARPFGQGAQGKPAYVPLPISMMFHFSMPEKIENLYLYNLCMY